MKKTYILFFLLYITQVSFGQKNSKIDKLNSKEDIENLIHSFDKKYEKFTLKPINEFKSNFRTDEYCKRISDSLDITKSFYKADFDNNGYTDLLAIGNYYDFKIFIVMNNQNDSLKIKSLTRSFQQCTFPKIINDTIIRYYQMTESDWLEGKTTRTLKFDDLVYKYGDFIEYNPKVNDYSIQKIEYQTTGCFGTCPIFFISIDKNRQGIFKAQSYNLETGDSKKEILGTFHTTLKESSFKKIINLLNYIDFPNLKDNYTVPWTDDQTSTLTITYGNGQVKNIRDYGLIGTYGLDRLYELLFEVRFNQYWQN